jgi:hypothetical protein
MTARCDSARNNGHCSSSRPCKRAQEPALHAFKWVGTISGCLVVFSAPRSRARAVLVWMVIGVVRLFPGLVGFLLTGFHVLVVDLAHCAAPNTGLKRGTSKPVPTSARAVGYSTQKLTIRSKFSGGFCPRTGKSVRSEAQAAPAPLLSTKATGLVRSRSWRRYQAAGCASARDKSNPG